MLINTALNPVTVYEAMEFVSSIIILLIIPKFVSVVACFNTTLKRNFSTLMRDN